MATTVETNELGASLDDVSCETLSVEAFEERKRGLQPGEELIAIRRDATTVMLPCFQADATARRINFLMGASARPVVALRRWRTSSPHLGGRTPLQVLGELKPAEMIQFAQNHMVG